MLLQLWMGVSVSLVEHVSCLTIEDGCFKHFSAVTTVDWCVCVSSGTFQCSDYCGLVCLYLWWNMSVL